MSRKDKRELQAAEQENAERYAAEYYAYDTTQKANVASLRKSRKFMGIGIVALLLAIALGFGTYWLQGQMTLSKKYECWAYEQKVEQFAQNYANKNGLASYPAYLEDMSGSKKVLTGKCPDGGQYTWNPVTGEYTCSVHGHYPSGWNAPRSQSLGTTTTVTTGNNKSNS
jgi:hypothetical protein